MRLLRENARQAFKKAYLDIRNRRIPYREASKEAVLQKKRSDTLIVLGTGYSINEIDEKQWRFISRHDTIGMNLWYIHSYVPTFLNYEPPKYPGPAYERWSEIPGLYDNVIFFLDARNVPKLFHPKYLPEAFPPNPKIYITPCSIKKPFPKTRTLTQDDFRGVPQKFGAPTWLIRGSLSQVIHIGYQMGYQKIILAGVDLNSPRYFMEREDYGKYSSISLIKGKDVIENYPRSWTETVQSGMHVSVHWGGYHAVDTYVPAFNRYVMEPEGRKIYVASKKSLLYPALDYHSLTDCAVRSKGLAPFEKRMG